VILNDITGLDIEIQTRSYIFHQIEFLERIESPKESNQWPYADYTPPKKLFCFRSTNNQVSILWSFPFLYFFFVTLYECFYSKIEQKDWEINISSLWKRFIKRFVWLMMMKQIFTEIFKNLCYFFTGCDICLVVLIAYMDSELNKSYGWNWIGNNMICFEKLVLVF